MQIFKFMRHECKLFFPSSLPHPPTPGNPMRACSQTDVKLACVAGVRKGRGRELASETTCKGGGRRGTPARKPLFSPSRLIIKKITKITQL